MFDAFDPDAPAATVDQLSASQNLSVDECGLKPHLQPAPRSNRKGNTTNRPEPAIIDVFGDKVVALTHNGEVLVQLKNLCDNLGVSYSTQYHKFAKIDDLDTFGVRHIVVYMDGAPRPQRYTFLTGRGMLGWLMTINPSRVDPEKRAKIVRYRTEALDVLERHFFGDRRPVPVDPRPTRAEPAVAQPAGDDPITGILNTMLRIRESQLMDQRRLDGIEADVRGVRDRIGDIEGAVNDATRRLLSVEAKVADPIALKPAPEPWFTVGEYCRKVGLNLNDTQRFEAGGGLHDLMAERGVRVKRRKTGGGYSVATYPLPILKEFFRGE